jgi:predicted amidohydrolase
MNLGAISPSYRVAAVQYSPKLGEKERNVRELGLLVQEAIAHQARLIVLPEMASTGYCWTSREEIAPYVEPIPGPTTEYFQLLATHHRCYIAVGLPEVDPLTQVYYNSVALLGPDGLVGTYRKLHSYIAEPRWARDGDRGLPVWETELGRISTLICMDAGYCESSRIAALHGADVVLLLTNWDDEACPSSRWMARAFENGVYVIASNRYDRERGVQFSGGSCVLNPDGSIQAYRDNGAGIVYGEVDIRRSRDKRWGGNDEVAGDRLADRHPAEYVSLVNNTYLWEPLRFHSLYAMGELPGGQLSCVGILQIDLSLFASSPRSPATQTIPQLVHRLLQENAPVNPDIVVLPELLIPGPVPTNGQTLVDHFRAGAISVPGPETAMLAALAGELQVYLVVGVAERAQDGFYNSVLLINGEGVAGVYRKLHLTQRDRQWASPGNYGLPTIDLPVGRVGLTAGYDMLFPETGRVLAGKGADLICAPACLNFPNPVGLAPTTIDHVISVGLDEYNPLHFLIWRVRAAENNVYLALANWCGQHASISANGFSGIFPPANQTYPWPEVVADEAETSFMVMTIDTREQRNGQRTTGPLSAYSMGQISGSLTGELAYSAYETIPGNVVRSKPWLRKRLPFWYLDLVKPNQQGKR